MPTYGPEMEGKTATSKDGKSRIVIRNGEAVRDTTYRPMAAASATNSDLTALATARENAAAARDATRTYKEAARALDDAGETGPWKDALLSAGAPSGNGDSPDRGWLGNALSTVVSVPMAAGGYIYRAITPRKQLAARDTLQTIAAKGALARSAALKGTASNSDMALIRLGGLGTAKYPEENRRILKDGVKEGGLAQTRALVTQQWIADYGSLKAKSSGGKTFEQTLQHAEDTFDRRFAERQAARRMPTPPPSVRKNRVRTYDLDGNPLN